MQSFRKIPFSFIFFISCMVVLVCSFWFTNNRHSFKQTSQSISDSRSLIMVTREKAIKDAETRGVSTYSFVVSGSGPNEGVLNEK